MLGQFWALLFCALLPAAVAFGSTTGALRDYKEGKYDEALKEYQRLLQGNTNDPRLHFNAGTAAYRQKSFTQAEREFDAALSAQDLQLQGRSYYNRGNTRFRLGEQNPEPTKRTEAWQGALKDFESSLKLNPQDTDAKSNYDFVKRKLEELKQQQPQQTKSDQNKDQDQQQKQDQQNQNSQKDQNQQQQQSQQAQSDQKKDSSQQNQQSQQQKQEDQQQAQAKDQGQQQKEQQQAQQENQQPPSPSAGQPKDKPEGNENGTAAVPGQMTPEQARQLLDAQKGDEQLLQLKPDKKPQDRSRPFKDW